MGGIQMSAFKAGFLMGSGAGVGLAMVALNMWATYMERRLPYLSLPPMLQPLARHQLPQAPKSPERLPLRWLPDTSSHVHEIGNIRPIDGKPTRLADFGGKVVFLNFWSTTCAPCIAEMPGIEKLQASMKNERVAFLAVTYEDGQTVRDFLKKVPLRVPIYLADQDSPGSCRVMGVPTAYILDRNGTEGFAQVRPVD